MPENRSNHVIEQEVRERFMDSSQLKTVILNALEDLKAVDIRVLDVTDVAGFTDLMIVASGNSSRQVKALADRVVERCKEAGCRPQGIEGEREAKWILVDLGDIVVHVMDPDTRAFYNLEKLWSVGDTQTSQPIAVH